MISIEYVISLINNFSATHPSLIYLLIFLFVFIEALAFVGIFFPGTVIIVFVGFMCYLGEFNGAVVFVITVLGALLGDLASYYIGKYKGVDLKLGKKNILKFLYIPEAGDFLLDKGGLSIILGRFIGPTRSFVPFYMGAAGEKERKFIYYDIAGVIAWAVFYLGLGYLLGNSYDLLKKFISGFEFFIALLIVLTICPFVIAKLFKKKLVK